MLSHSFAAFLSALVLSHSCAAQTSGLFKWSFTDAPGETLTECSSLPITIESTGGKAPFYMMAFPSGGTPTTSLIGTGTTDLKWIVNQPSGSKILLNVIDSTGSSGGTSAFLYTVATGPSKSCLAPPSSSFSVSSNATTEISTCDPWGFVLKGGQSPYTVVLAAVDSPSITNVTLPAGDNAYTYINRAGPNGALIAAFSDATGAWASGTPFVSTKGSSDTECGGASSSSGKAPVDSSSSSSGSSSRSTTSNFNTSLSTSTSPTSTLPSGIMTTSGTETSTGTGTADGGSPLQTNGALGLMVRSDSVFSILLAGVAVVGSVYA
ncbi:hypothetical protein Hypma_010518 [Hypsizygus marmoreus]|uniref:Uncharacterized protein n=1 Tax=Hypsizygus marmoreus TaxID=39966 RepID=A0A369JUH2_HYPMA|nr:hypothetical protein Hypma_010518 [Hypsizygus marmoreus]